MSCSNLKVIERKNNWYYAAHRIGQYNPALSSRSMLLLKYVHPLSESSRLVSVVPCGKCLECLKRRQTDLAVRCEREAVKRGSMHFVTLTYRQEYLPFAYRYSVVDYETGEIIKRTPYMLGVRSGVSTDMCEELHESILKDFKSHVPGRSPLYISRVVCESVPGSEYLGVISEFTPSLNRRDLRLWLKSCRVQYKREFGKDLPEFSYVATGELGPRTCRPHYHICFFGLTDSIVRWFISRWKYGTESDMKRVLARNPDGSSGFNRASRYVAKYISKGKFECASVKCEDCEKPRLCMSKGLGNYLDFQLISYFRAYDLFGKYNPDTLVLEGTKRAKLSQEQIDKLIIEIRKRSFVRVDSGNNEKDVRLPLPRSIIRKLWYVYDKKNKLYRSCTLRAVAASAARNEYFTLREQKFRAFVSDNFSLSLSEACTQFASSIENSRVLEQEKLLQDFQRFYSKSLF